MVLNKSGSSMPCDGEIVGQDGKFAPDAGREGVGGGVDGWSERLLL